MSNARNWRGTSNLARYRLIHLDRIRRDAEREELHHVDNGERTKARSAARRADHCEDAIRFKLQQGMPGDLSLLRLQAELGLLSDS